MFVEVQNIFNTDVCAQNFFMEQKHSTAAQKKKKKKAFSPKCCYRIWLLREMKGRAEYKHKSFEKQQKRKGMLKKANVSTEKENDKHLSSLQ